MILQTTYGDSRLHPDFPPSVVVDSLADSSINMVLRLYLKDPSQEIEMGFEYAEKVRETLRRAGIEIPFPHLQVFMKEPGPDHSDRPSGTPARPPWKSVG